MEEITLIIAIAAMFLSGYLYFKVSRENKKNRILQAFVAGLMRSITDYNSKTDAISPGDVPKTENKNPISYKSVLEAIQYEFSKDFWEKPYQEWLKHDRLIFNDEKFGNDGFNFIYWDLFDKAHAEWNEGEKASEKVKNRI